MCEIKISSNDKYCKRSLTVIEECLLAPIPIVWLQQPDVLTSILNISVWFSSIRLKAYRAGQTANVGSFFLPFTPQSFERLPLQDGDTYNSSLTAILTTGMQNCSQTSSYFFLYTHKKSALWSSLLGILVESEPLRASTLFYTTAGKSPFSTPVLTGLGMRV